MNNEKPLFDYKTLQKKNKEEVMKNFEDIKKNKISITPQIDLPKLKWPKKKKKKSILVTDIKPDADSFNDSSENISESNLREFYKIFYPKNQYFLK